MDCNGNFLALLWQHSLAVLNIIVTMDNSAIFFHNPQMKRQSKQWAKKGQPGPRKARVLETQSKKMDLVFFDTKGVIYTNYIPYGETVNAEYVKKALVRFLKVFREKRLIKDWFLLWEVPVHTAASVQNYLVAKGFQMICHPPCSLDLALADFFLFPRVKPELVGLSLTQESFQKSWVGVIWTIPQDNFATAFQRWMERNKKFIQMGSNYVKKQLKINYSLN